jgi:sugar phosphate isomerase/epimerase
VIDVRSWNLPFRIGTTSYIVPDDLLPNAKFLAAYVQDMQLVLFEVSGGPTNLPTPQAVESLAAWGRARDLTYTVHLLHDLRRYDEDGSPAIALAKAQQVIELTRPLDPLAWVCHLDGRNVRHADASSPLLAHWQTQTVVVLQQVCNWAGDAGRVAVENLEGYAPDFVVPIVARTSAGRCLDVGHLWLDGMDPLPHLVAALPRLRVLHLHGVQPASTTEIETGIDAGLLAGKPARGTDHSSLAYADPQQLDAMLRRLLAAQFDGVLCLEVFGEDDFHSSLLALDAAVQRVRGER